MTWLDNIGLEQPSANEFLANPDLRQISTFFLGSLFIISLYYLCQSRPVLYIRRRIDRIFKPRSHLSARPALDLEAGSVSDEKVISGLTHPELARPTYNHDPMHFVFFLTLCVLLASVMQFTSLLAYNSRSDAACAFVVAWGGMAAHCVRLFGLLKLSFVLQDFGARRWETITFWALLVVSIALMLFTNATSVGIIKSLANLPTVAFCYRKHLLLTALLSAILNMALEAYAMIRFFVLSVPPFLNLRHQLDALIDIRLGWAASLLLLDLLTLVPSLVPITVTADFVPFSIGALFVVVAFNHSLPPPVSDLDTMTIPGTIAVSLQPGDGVSLSRYETQTTMPPTPPSKTEHEGSDASAAAPESTSSLASLQTNNFPAPPPVNNNNFGQSSLVPFSFRQEGGGRDRHSSSFGNAGEMGYFPTIPVPSAQPFRARAIIPTQGQYVESRESREIAVQAQQEHSVPPPPRAYKPDIRIDIPGVQLTPPHTGSSSIRYGSDIIAGPSRNAMKRHSTTSSAPEFTPNFRGSTFSSPSTGPQFGTTTPSVLSPGDDRSDLGYLSASSDVPRTTLSSKRLTFGKSPRPSGPRERRPRPPPLEPVAGQKRSAPGELPMATAGPVTAGPSSAARFDIPKLSVRPQSSHPGMARRRGSIGPGRELKRLSAEPSSSTSSNPRRTTLRFSTMDDRS